MEATSTAQILARLTSIESSLRLQAKDILTIDEAAVYTGMSKSHLYRLTSTRGIPHFKQGMHLYFDKTELRAWLTSCRISTTAETERQAENYLTAHKL